MKKILKILGILVWCKFMIFIITPIKYIYTKSLTINFFYESTIIFLFNFLILLFLVKKWNKKEKILAYTIYFIFCVYYYTTEPILKNIVPILLE